MVRMRCKDGKMREPLMAKTIEDLMRGKKEADQVLATWIEGFP